jgi:hypothetical protein
LTQKEDKIDLLLPQDTPTVPPLTTNLLNSYACENYYSAQTGRIKDILSGQIWSLSLSVVICLPFLIVPSPKHWSFVVFAKHYKLTVAYGSLHCMFPLSKMLFTQLLKAGPLCTYE